MRKIAYTLTALLLGVPLLAQQPVAPQQPPADPKLEAALGAWEKAMGSLSTFVIQCSRTKVDKTFGTVDQFEGVAKYLKPDKAMLHLSHKTKAGVFEKFIINDRALYEWAPANKVVRIHQLPAAKKGQMGDDNFLSMIVGMKAADAKNRYLLRLLPPPQGDTWYQYIEVLPRRPGQGGVHAGAAGADDQHGTAAANLVPGAERQRDHLGLRQGVHERAGRSAGVQSADDAGAGLAVPGGAADARGAARGAAAGQLMEGEGVRG